MPTVLEFTTDNLNYGHTLPRVNPQPDTASNSVVGGFRSFSPPSSHAKRGLHISDSGVQQAKQFTGFDYLLLPTYG